MRENRIRTVLLYDKEIRREEIKEILLLDLQTIRRYINDFQLYRMDSIDFDDRRKSKSGNKKVISPKEEEQVKKFVEDNLIEESKEVQKYIKDEFGIEYKEATVLKLLHDLGFVYKKVVTIPQKANTTESTQKQLEFEERYEKLKKELYEIEGITPYFLPSYSPELNPVERFFGEIRKATANRIFKDIVIQEEIISNEVVLWINDKERAKRLCGYSWILEQWDKLDF